MNIQQMLSLLEIKIKFILEEKQALLLERDALAQKVIELQDKIDDMQDKINNIKIEYSTREEDAVLTSLVVEDLLQIIEDAEQNSPSNNIIASSGESKK